MTAQGPTRRPRRSLLALVVVLGLAVLVLATSCQSTATSSSAAARTSERGRKPRPSPTATYTPTPSPSICTSPVWVTSERDATWSDGGYILHNNMWNAKGYKVSQTVYACAYDNWYLVATADNSKGDGAVKTYPNVHKDYHDWSTGAEPRLDSFATLTSSFAATSPPVGIYDVAYDIWLNGVPGNREVMIWTQNHRQVPFGALVDQNVMLSGHSWDVYAESGNSYLAFVPSEPLPSGSLNLKEMLDWLTAQGRIPANATLGQICYGVEVVSTDGAPATFTFTGFSISESRR